MSPCQLQLHERLCNFCCAASPDGANVGFGANVFAGNSKGERRNTPAVAERHAFHSFGRFRVVTLSAVQVWGEQAEMVKMLLGAGARPTRAAWLYLSMRDRCWIMLIERFLERWFKVYKLAQIYPPAQLNLSKSRLESYEYLLLWDVSGERMHYTNVKYAHGVREFSLGRNHASGGPFWAAVTLATRCRGGHLSFFTFDMTIDQTILGTRLVTDSFKHF